MQETPLQQPAPRSSAGYRPLVPASIRQSAVNPVYAYLAAAAGLGMVVGAGIAFTAAGPAKVATPPSVSYTESAHTSGLSALPASYTGPAPSLLSKVDNQKNASAATPPFSAPSEKSVKKTATGRRHGLHRLWPWKRSSDDPKAPKRKPYVSPNAPAAPTQPTALELATAAAAIGPFVLAMEGDATVASYDVAAGTIGTYEGNTFVLDKTGNSSAIPWEDFPFNVHYRCDQNGNCTMIRHGATAGARITR